MEGYSVKIKEASMELSARERIIMKDTSNAIKLDEATKEGTVIINPAGFVVLDVHNEKSDNKDYEVFIIVDKSGDKYVTGSKSFISSFEDIFEEMEGEGDYSVVAYRLESKNYKGKDFLTCSLM